jgi:hypothetical protein
LIEDVFEVDDEKYIDIQITCYDLKDEDKKILEGIPPIRLIFS